MWLVPLGVAAGALTTLAGLGGGLMLLLALSLAWTPQVALAVTSPALLVGNLHRLVLYREHVDWRVARRLAGGAIPGALIGGILVAAMPALVLKALLGLTTALALGRAAGKISWKWPPSMLFPAGLGVGALSATTGGAGLLMSPILLATGLNGTAYVSTGAACAFAMHVGRVGGYGLGGLLGGEVLFRSLALVVGILLGNFVADHFRHLISKRSEVLVEHGTLMACAVLAILGIGG